METNNQNNQNALIQKRPSRKIGLLFYKSIVSLHHSELQTFTNFHGNYEFTHLNQRRKICVHVVLIVFETYIGKQLGKIKKKPFSHEKHKINKIKRS